MAVEKSRAPELLALELRALTKSFPGSDAAVLSRIDARFEPGRLHVFQGASGSGKTTLMKILATLQKPDGTLRRIEAGDFKKGVGRSQILARLRDAGLIGRAAPNGPVDDRDLVTLLHALRRDGGSTRGNLDREIRAAAGVPGPETEPPGRPRVLEIPRSSSRADLRAVLHPLLAPPRPIAVRYSLRDPEGLETPFDWTHRTPRLSRDLRRLRGQVIRFASQEDRLIFEFSALQNLLLPDEADEALLSGTYDLLAGLFRDRMAKEMEILIDEHRAHPDWTFAHLFHTAAADARDRGLTSRALSGGQRALLKLVRAIGSADVHGKLILADEPTGELDPDGSLKVWQLLARIAERNIVLVVSHDKELPDCIRYTLDAGSLEVGPGEIQRFREAVP